MTWRPFVPPSVSFQSKLTLHLSFYPSICVSSYVTSTHLSHTIHPSAAVVCCHHLRPSVCLHVRPQRVLFCSLYVLTVCVKCVFIQFHSNITVSLEIKFAHSDAVVRFTFLKAATSCFCCLEVTILHPSFIQE